MYIYYKCSFKSSNGYKLGRYDADSDTLAYISERDGEDRKSLSKAAFSTFRNELGRSMMLASDEQGHFFLGVYKLIEGDYEKYVNTIFVDKDSEKIAKLFFLFCSRYKWANSVLSNSVKRVEADESGLEFSIVKEEIDIILKAADATEKKELFKSGSGMLLAFVTEDDYNDYVERIEQKCKLRVLNTSIVKNIPHGKESIEIEDEIGRTSFLLPKSARYVIILLVAILLVLVYLLGDYFDIFVTGSAVFDINVLDIVQMGLMLS